MSIFESYRGDKSLTRVAAPVISGLVFLFVFVSLVLAPVVTRAQQSGQNSTVLNTSIELESGTIDLDYSSVEGKLKVSYNVDDRKQEFTVSSGGLLGVLIEVSGVELRYTIRFLESKDFWELKNLPGKRTEISLKPGWRIVLVEKEMDRKLNT